MLTKKILKNLETGNYRVEYREKCGCEFYWSVENDELVCETVNYYGDCWFDNVLIMDDLAGQCDETVIVGSDGNIVSYDAYFGLTVFLIKASQDVVQEIVNAIQNSDAYQKLTAGINSPEANNDLHYRRRRESLVKWLEKQNYWRC